MKIVVEIKVKSKKTGKLGVKENTNVVPSGVDLEEKKRELKRLEVELEKKNRELEMLEKIKNVVQVVDDDGDANEVASSSENMAEKSDGVKINEGKVGYRVKLHQRLEFRRRVRMVMYADLEDSEESESSTEDEDFRVENSWSSVSSDETRPCDDNDEEDECRGMERERINANDEDDEEEEEEDKDECRVMERES
ncbi:uncharacterized protein LOC132273160 [Cornus florida]|uniref:uncharacterized protein LOC132273160 n=1 Tax=Cornus florida TaxID=4283 RepID=UPI00289B871D|nr:uncharacterized protein LOC132273160 [Cornus florida]